MLSIGELSKLCRISTKTLRHYDRIGLIKPAYVNEENNYRYYDIQQVKDIVFIGQMKNYGFMLSDISYMLAARNKLEIKSKMLQKREELQKSIIEMNFFLKQLDQDIEHFEGSLEFMSTQYEVTLVERKPCHIVSVRRYMGIKDFEKAYEDLFEIIHKNNYTICGPSMAIYFSEEFDPEHTDIETACPIEETSGENVRQFDGGLCCMTKFVGPYIDFSPAYVAIERWVKENQYTIVAPPFEVYAKGMDSGVPPDEFVTEVYFPIQK